jgi:hypothetical protein
MTLPPPDPQHEPLFLRVQTSRWLGGLPERSQNEILFACMYATSFVHGTDGHHRLLLIADLAERLTAQEEQREALE